MSDVAAHPQIADEYPAISESRGERPRSSSATWRRSAAISCSARGASTSAVVSRSPATSETPAADARRSKVMIVAMRCLVEAVPASLYTPVI